jgi:hypothetical protein
VSASAVVDTVHWLFAFLLILCGLTLGWVQLGRRVMIALIGIQVLIGLVNAAMLGGVLGAKTARFTEHVLGALLATVAYVVGRRIGAQSSSPTVPLVMSALGLVLLIVTAYLGLKTSGRIA